MKLVKYDKGWQVYFRGDYLGLIVTDYGDYTCFIDGHTVASSDVLWKAKVKFLIKYFFYTLYR